MIKQESFSQYSIKNQTDDSDLNGLKPQKCRRVKQKGHAGWSIKENILYISWLQENCSDFSSQFERRSKKVFLKLSNLLDNRTPEQCRSHHQKMMKKNKSISKITEYLLKKAAKKGYRLPQQPQVEQNECKIEEIQKSMDSVTPDFHEAEQEMAPVQVKQQYVELKDEKWDNVFNF